MNYTVWHGYVLHAQETEQFTCACKFFRQKQLLCFASGQNKIMHLRVPDSVRFLGSREPIRLQNIAYPVIVVLLSSLQRAANFKTRHKYIGISYGNK